MGYPHSWMVYSGKSHLEVDDDWGYPYLRKPTFCFRLTRRMFKKETSLPRQHPAWILTLLRIATGQPDEDQSSPKAGETNIYIYICKDIR